MSQLHISLQAEKVIEVVDGVHITNSIISTWIVMAILLIFSLLATRKMKLVPTGLQTITEVLVDGLQGLFENVMKENYKRHFALLATIFLFIIISNWAGLLPGVGTIGLYDDENKFVPIFRAGTADLNLTLALAIIAVATIQYEGLRTLGVSYLKKFFNISNPINFFVGILELISEFSKIISFSFRLFGNIFAGEVLLTVIAFLVPVFAPLPFLGLELFVGFIQALVFSMLTSVFLLLATSKEGH
ncbi:F0F1 ATP synthase subunit A [Candidatus Gottesmanbacteria bacterium]|nr:F0F1 ATP synthase subunit A [Candidatus Gottesmanbacteria bacterium]